MNAGKLDEIDHKILNVLQGNGRLSFMKIANYEEPTNWLYGEAVFTAGELHHVPVNSFDGEDWYSDPEFVAIKDLQADLLSGSSIKR